VPSLIGLLLLAGPMAFGQGRQFWVLDNAGALRLTTPGDITVGSIPLQGAPKAVRGTPSGYAVVSDAGGSWVHLVSGTSVMAVELPGGVEDAIPDGDGGAWVLVRRGQSSGLYRVSGAGAVDPLGSYSGIATRVLGVRSGRLVFCLRQGGLSSLCLVGENGALLDQRPLMGAPVDLVLDNRGTVLVPGSASGWLRSFHVVGGRLVPSAVWPVAVPLTGVACFSGSDDLLVAEGWPPELRLIKRGAGFLPPILGVGTVGAMEGLPRGGVLVHDPSGGVAWLVERDGLVSWTGAWSASWTWPDGAGMQHARARPEEDPDGDGFSNAAEIEAGTDPGSPHSAPLALWREGSVFHLRTVLEPMFYVLVASDDVIPGSQPLLCAPTPLMTAATQPGVLFDLPWGGSAVGSVQVSVLPGLQGDPWVACAAYSADLRRFLVRGARRISQW